MNIEIRLFFANFVGKVMDEEKVDEEANGFIQSFLLQPRQHANPPGSRFNFFVLRFVYKLFLPILLYDLKDYCTGMVLATFQHERMAQLYIFSLLR